MKTINNIRVFAIALVAIFTTAIASPALANDEKKAIPVELKFAGNMKNQPLFHLVFTGTEETEFTIVIRDEYGNALYRDNVKGTSFTKKFLLNVEELDTNKLKFEISSKSYDKSVVFEINNQSRFVEDIAINRIK